MMITSCNVGRTASTSTFDSLDMARFSDDGGVQVDEKIAGIFLEMYSILMFLGK